MKFQVPQFIDVEDKIFGPLTLKQFIYLAGSAGLCIIYFLFLPTWLAIIPALLSVGFASLLAFFKYNNRPFVVFVESLFMYFINPKLYIWKKQDKQIVRQEVKKVSPESTSAALPRLSNSKLKDLSWSLDTRDPKHSELS